ncbi:MFS transporter [Halalkalicoccus sp. NIPERK01]|uniref:MFS transporter n=1 Tax=Halalkalicoccus sp. NIPERK01 TaxID=3053469 RepID=UPI00256EB8A4|nr:MFS transporter [Halalkalicoccus sp. NIPERK01]
MVGSISLAHGANEFFSVALPPIIPLLVSDLGISYAQAGFLLTVFFVMYSIFQLPAGVLADRLGKKRLLVAGLGGMAGAVALAATAGGYETLLVAQAVAGISGSTFHPTGMSLISDVETSSTEGKAMGVFGFGGMVGTMASPVLIGGLAALFGWRVALGAAAALGLVVTLAFVPLFDESETESKPESDDATRPRSDGGRSFSPRAPLRSAVEAVDVPVTRGIAVLFCVTVLISLQSRAIQTFTTTYIAAGTGGSTSVGNLGFFALLAGGSLSSLWAGSLSDRFDRGSLGVVAALSTTLLVGATLFVTRLPGDVPAELLFAFLAVWFFVIGAVMYACVPVKNALISEQAEREFSGSLFGVIQTASAIGSASGPAVFGVLATEWGVVAAYPAIAVVSLSLAGLFFVLSRITN